VPPSSPRRSFDPRLDPALFRAQLAYLGDHYRLVSGSDLPAAAAARGRGEPFPVAVTFDDDLLSHVEEALPALQEAGAPATFFLNASSLRAPHSFWWQRLQRAVERGAAWPPPAAGARRVPEAGQRVEELAPAARDELAEALLAEAGPDPSDSGLRADGVRRLAEAGHQIGFHTRHHHRLTQLHGADLDRELTDGRAELESLAGTPLDAIAYPHGRADARVAAAARAAGYRIGFTTRAEAVTPRSDPLLLGRVEAPYDSVAKLAARIAFVLAAAVVPGHTERPLKMARRAYRERAIGRAALKADPCLT
jgi:peptidoglycan/xylan/chitin deacetylase (PgdA/CDA1 family)